MRKFNEKKKRIEYQEETNATNEELREKNVQIFNCATIILGVCAHHAHEFNARQFWSSVSYVCGAYFRFTFFVFFLSSSFVLQFFFVFICSRW